MNYYTQYKDLRLDELEIASHEEAEELEYELELRFEDFTSEDRKSWLEQNAYLEHFSRIGTVTSAAREARVTVYTAQRWQINNELGFNRRLEIADLAFTDSLREKALRRASDPKASATLLIELLRAYIPEKFSKNGHKCDSSKSEDQFRRSRESTRRERDAGYPTFRKIAEGATNAHPGNNAFTEPTRPCTRPASPDRTVTLTELRVPDLSPRVGTLPRTPSPVVGEDWGEGDASPSSAPPAPSAASPLDPANRNLSRAERRELLRQQRKAEKKNTFPVKRF